jgi:hypothetical protein
VKSFLAKTVHLLFFSFEAKFFFVIAAVLWGCAGMAGGAILGKWEEENKIVRFACDSDMKLTADVDDAGNKIYECSAKTLTPKF